MDLRFRVDPDRDPFLRVQLERYCAAPTRPAYLRLYASCRDYYTGILFVGFVRRTLECTARRLRHVVRRRRGREVPVLDAVAVARRSRHRPEPWRRQRPVPVTDSGPPPRSLLEVPTDPGLARGIARLTPCQRNVIWLTVCRGVPEAAVARQLGTSQQSVNRTKRRALKRLRAMLGAFPCKVS